jgi:hypothetical protein
MQYRTVNTPLTPRSMMQQRILVPFIFIFLLLITTGCTNSVAKPSAKDLDQHAMFGNVILDYRIYSDFSKSGIQGMVHTYKDVHLRNVTIIVDFYNKEKTHLATKSQTFFDLHGDDADVFIVISKDEFKMPGDNALSDTYISTMTFVQVNGVNQTMV